MRRRTAAGLGIALAASMVIGSAASAGDGKGAKPKAPAAPAPTDRLPERFARKHQTLMDMRPDESTRVDEQWIRVTKDGTAWVQTSIYLVQGPEAETPEAFARTVKITRTSGQVFDADVTGCDVLWAADNEDGTPYVPGAGDVRIGKVACGADPPSATMPPRFLGRRLWEVAPGESVYVSARHVGVDRRGEAWVDPQRPGRATRTDDPSIPEVQVTASDRDCVKLGLTGVVYRWLQSDVFPRVTDLHGADGLGGHKQTPFGVTSFINDGAVATRMPPDFLVPQVRDLAAGAGGFVDPFFTRIAPDGTLWIDEKTPVTVGQGTDGWGFRGVRIVMTPQRECSADLSGTNYRWCLADDFGRRLPERLEAGNEALEVRWFRVSEISDGAAKFGAAMPADRRAERIWTFEPGARVYASCRHLFVDRDLHGFVSGWAPVALAPFTDEHGPAIAVTIGADGASCTVDLTGVADSWDRVETPKLGPEKQAVAGGPKINYLRVTQFVAPPAPEPPKPKNPPKGGK